MDIINIADLTEKLISFPSTSSNKNALFNIIQFCKDYLSHEDVVIKCFEKNGIPSLIATFEDTLEPDILLVGHLDVVTAEDFSSRRTPNRVYGRGSGDMKGSDAAMLNAFRFFYSNTAKPSLGIMLTTDEETGGQNGTKYLLEEKKYRPKFAIVPDSSFSLSKIVIQEKGILHLSVTAQGKSCHASRPFDGENALGKLIVLCQKLETRYPETKKTEWKTTVTPTCMRGGDTVNTIPNFAEMKLDIRFIDDSEKNAILDMIQTLGCDYKILVEASAFLQDPTHHYIQKYKELTGKYLQKDVEFVKEFGGADSRFFSEQKIPCIVVGPEKGNTHSPNEWVNIEELEIFSQILIEFTKDSTRKISPQ